MSFHEVYLKHKDFDFESFLNSVSDEDVQRVLGKERLDAFDFLTLLSNRADGHLEKMAQRANRLSLQHFGKAVVLYTPIYLSNYCVNKCAYCSFNLENDLARKQLTMAEVELEAKKIASTGLKHILVLSGESRVDTPVSYIVDAVRVLKKYFDSIAIEIYPLTEEEYERVYQEGVDGLTIYQETYDEATYKKVHLAGPKRNYMNRLDAPERGCKAGLPHVNIGALLGLFDWKKDSFMTALHARYLIDRYSDVEVSISLPRMRPFIGGYQDITPVSDREFVRVLLAFRNYLPYAGITVSTREEQAFRDHLIPLGVTKMSAGVATEVGGHAMEEKSESQFEISDTRSVDEICQAIRDKGYQPVLKDWMRI